MHSQNHLDKLKPAIEQLCQQHQFKYYVEQNEGRILVQFGQGAGQLSQGEAASYWSNRPNYNVQQGPSQSQGYQPQQQYQQPQQQFQYQESQGQGNQGDVVEQIIKEAAPGIFKKLRQCCTIM